MYTLSVVVCIAITGYPGDCQDNRLKILRQDLPKAACLARETELQRATGITGIFYVCDYEGCVLGSTDNPPEHYKPECD